MKILLINHHDTRKTMHFRPGFFARKLALKGHEVTVLCLSDARRFGFELDIQDGVHYVRSPDLFWGKLRTGWDPWSLVNRIHLLRRREFDLVHAFETRPATIHPVRSYLRRCPGPLVMDWIDWWGRGGLIREQRPGWYRILFGRLETFYEEHFRTLADGTTVISHALGERAVALGVPRETIYWIPNGAPVEEFSVVPPGTHRREFGLPLDATILADSALDVTIGMDLLMETLKCVAREHPAVLFMMTGAKQRELTALAGRHGVAAYFRHLGRLPFGELGKALSCADLFVMPFRDCVANRGRWPGRIGSYMALGRPIVSNPVGEVALLMGQERIGLLAAETPDAFAGKILTLVRDGVLRQELGANARQLAERRFTWDCVVADLERCYKATVNRYREHRRGGAPRLA